MPPASGLSRLSIKIYKQLLFAMALCSLALLLFCHSSLNKSEINVLTTYSGVDVSGYRKESLFEINEDKEIVLDCAIGTIRAGSTCGLQFDLRGRDGAGSFVNLHNLAFINVYATAENPGIDVNLPLKLTLRSLRQDVEYNDRDPSTTRYQSVRFSPGAVQQLSKDRVTTDQWWVRQFDVPFSAAGTDFSSISHVSVNFAGNVLSAPGRYLLHLHELVFVSYFIAPTFVHTLLSIAWPIIFLFLLGHYLRIKSKEVSRLQALADYDTEFDMLNLHGFKRRYPSSLKQPLTIVNIRLRNFAALQREFSRETVLALINSTFIPFSQGDKSGPVLVKKQDENLLMVMKDCDEAFFATLVSAAQRGVNFPSLGHLRLDVKMGIARGTAGMTIDEVLSQSTIAIDAILDAEPSYKVYEPALKKEYRQARFIEQELRIALQKQAFNIVFMPVYDVVSKRIAGAEVLLRTSHLPLAGFSPEVYITVAEKVGLIRDIDFWVMEQAVQALKSIPESDFTLSVNISSKELMDTRFAEELKRLIEKYQVDASYLCLEITETFFVDVNTMCFESIQALKQLGIRLSLDDFGTGHASLQHLLNMPINELKIDRSFVWTLDDKKSAVIVDAIISIASICKYDVVAEGVETEEQMHKLSGLGCRYFQGYLIARPAPLDALLQTCQSINRKVRTLN